MKRDNATGLIELVLSNQVAGQYTWPLEPVDKTYVFRLVRTRGSRAS